MSFSSFPIFHKSNINQELAFGMTTHASSSVVYQSEEVHRQRGRPPVYSSDAERTQARREKTAVRLRRYRSASRTDLRKLHNSPTEQCSEPDKSTGGKENTSQTSSDECLNNAKLVFRSNNQSLPSQFSVEISDWVLELPLPHSTRGEFLLKNKDFRNHKRLLTSCSPRS